MFASVSNFNVRQPALMWKATIARTLIAESIDPGSTTAMAAQIVPIVPNPIESV